MQNGRLKSGEWIAMSPEQKKEHLHKLQKRYRIKNKAKISKLNHLNWLRYKSTNPFDCICKRCGTKFMAPRNYYKLCAKCAANVHIVANQKKEVLNAKRAEKQKMIQKILTLARKGITQQKIAEKFNYTQCGISAIMRKYGIHRGKNI